MSRKSNSRPNPRRAKLQPETSQVAQQFLKAYEESRHRLRIKETTRTPSGQTIDWVPIESQIPRGKIATPPPTSTRGVAASESNQRAAHFELTDSSVAGRRSGQLAFAEAKGRWTPAHAASITPAVRATRPIWILSRHERRVCDLLWLPGYAQCLGLHL
jgi:hypothetical protein